MELKTGKFSITPGKCVSGELTIAGRQSSVTLRGDEDFMVGVDDGCCIRGILYDQREVTLIDCTRTGEASHRVGTQGAKSHSVTLFPHFVAEGQTHFEPDSSSIEEIAFTFEDVTSLFYDFDAFGAAMDATQFIDPIVDANAKMFHRDIPRGPAPQIAYFTGRRLITEVDTSIGRIRAEHHPSWPMGGPRGVRIDNEIWISITPSSPVNFDNAVDRLMRLLRFMAVAVGRQQNLPQFVVTVGTRAESRRLRVYWSNHPRRVDDEIGERSAPQPGDLPLQPIHHRQEFDAVLTSWLAVDESRQVARIRIHQSLAHQNRYSVDRLVGAANAFDLLPEPAVPKKVQLSSEVTDAIKVCKPVFKALPKGDERESLLRAIGRLGNAALKQKVRFRAMLITSMASTQFPELAWVCDQAIECRNHFVHGSSFEIDLEPPATNQGFLTDTLEFVFTASELVENGWDINRFLNTPTSMSHPFGAYRVDYVQRMNALRAAAEKVAGGASQDA